MAREWRLRATARIRAWWGSSVLPLSVTDLVTYLAR
jgi:hypothetical protein